jgi:hypothetical protein
LPPTGRRFFTGAPAWAASLVFSREDSNSRGQQLRQRRARTLIRTAAARNEANDYQAIRATLPVNFPGLDDVVSDIFEAMLAGRLRREDVRAHVQTYITAFNRMYPTKFAKFGDARLVSLDG